MKQSTYIRRLSLLRVVFISALFVAEKFIALTKGVNASLPYRWLNHYLIGTGKDMAVPDNVVVEATGALQRALRADSYGSYDEVKELPYEEKKKALRGKAFCVCHSTLYEGSGFHERPTLFYLLGGFTFKIERVTRKGNSIVAGTDHYDWHGTIGYDGETHYFCSPLGTNIFLKKICRFLDWYTGGKQLFTDNCWPTCSGEAGISNKLWEEFKKVGAAEFNSFFRTEVKLNFTIK